jgi:hypothetical protein
MRVPQVTERIKEAPVQALRGVLAGIGQVLLFTDKLRNKNPAETEAPAEAATATDSASGPASAAAEAEVATVAEAPVTAEAATAPAAEAATAAEAAPAAEAATATEPAPAKATPAKTRKPRKPRDLDKTGNVTILTEEDAAPAPAEAPAAEAPAEVAAEVTAEPEAPVEVEVSLTETVVVSAADLPMPTYDELTVASIRARMRNLTAAQVATLAEYEKAHAARPDIITMFERRIAKLEAEG